MADSETLADTPVGQGLETALGVEDADRPPSVDELRRIADVALLAPLGTTFERFVPGISSFETESHDLLGASSARLANVLARWKGPRWGPYLAMTPSDLIGRRNCGLRSLGEFIWLARRRVARTRDFPPPGLNADLDRHAFESEASETKPAEHQTTDDDRPGWHQITDAIGIALAWATHERGRDSALEGLRLGLADTENLPAIVGRAQQLLAGLDARQLTGQLAGPFDVRAQLKSILEGLDDRELEIVDRRIVALGRVSTLDELGHHLGITRERVRQLESRVKRRVRAGVVEDLALERTTARVRNEVGLAVKAERVPDGISAIAETHFRDPASLEVRLLLWLAGPYETNGDWLVLAPASGTVLETKAAADEVIRDGDAAVVALVDRLSQLGLRSDEAADWLISVGGYRIRDDRIVRWGGSLADKAELVLRLNGQPMKQNSLQEAIGATGSLRSMLAQISGG